MKEKKEKDKIQRSVNAVRKNKKKRRAIGRALAVKHGGRKIQIQKISRISFHTH
jgi:hypothetical protein